MDNNENSLQLEIGEKINKLRRSKKLSMRELADKLGVSHAHISKLESGINSPSVDLLEKLADFFNIDLAYFFAKETEDEIVYEKNLSLEYLKEKYNLVVAGKPATDEEIEEMIQYIKFLRNKKEMEGT